MFSPQLYITSEDKVRNLKEKNDFEEDGDENIFVHFKNGIRENFDLIDLNEIKVLSDKNFSAFLKNLYIYKLDNKTVAYPINVMYPDDKVEFRGCPISLLDDIIHSGFLAHKILQRI